MLVSTARVVRGGSEGSWRLRVSLVPARRELPDTLIDRPFTVAEARELGVSDKTLRRASLGVPFAGVRRVDDADQSLADVCASALTFLPDGALFSHVTALRLLGVEIPWLLESDDAVHVTVPVSAVVPRRAGLVAHTTELGPLPAVWVGELPTTSPAQTWVQLAGSLRTDDLVVLADAMTRRKRPTTSLQALKAAVARSPAGTRGIRRLREALKLTRPGTDSSMETRARLVIVQGGLPCPIVNQPVLDNYGRFVALPDMSYPELKIAIEYDGDVHRTDQATWRRDIARRQALEAQGWRVITLTADDVLRHPDRLLSWLRAAIRR